MSFGRQQIVGFALVVLSGCGSQSIDGDRSHESQLAVNEGTVDRTTTAVLGVVSDRADGYHLCTGTLVLPNLVLTARHCVSEAPQTPTCGRTTFGDVTDISKLTLTTEVDVAFGSTDIEAEAVWLPEDALFCGGDHALILLAEPIDASAAVPIVPRVDQAAIAGEPFSAIGYGTIDGTGKGLGTRHRGDGFAVDCVGAGCESEFVVGSEWSSKSGHCAGDSGGPAIDAAGRVFGVVSRGFGACGMPILGDVAAFGDWLKERANDAASLGGFDAPAWASGWPTDPAYSAPIGAMCTITDECAPGVCIDRICTRQCNEAAPCPEGTQCSPSEAASYCLPEDVSGTGGAGASGNEVSTGTSGSAGGGDGSGGSESPASNAGSDRDGDDGCTISPVAVSRGSMLPWFTIAAVAIAGARHTRRRTRRSARTTWPANGDAAVTVCHVD